MDEEKLKEVERKMEKVNKTSYLDEPADIGLLTKMIALICVPVLTGAGFYYVMKGIKLVKNNLIIRDPEPIAIGIGLIVTALLVFYFNRK